MSRVLVVGSRGYLGPHVVQLLQEASHDVIEADAGFWGQSIPPEIKKDASKRGFREWAIEQKPDAVVYLAAIAHDPERKFSDGVHLRHTAHAPQDLADWLPGVPFVFTSSLSVFDPGKDIYPYCKRGAEDWLFNFVAGCSILRFGTLYGPGVSAENYRPHLLLNRMCYTALKHGKVEVFNPAARRPVLCVDCAANVIENQLDWMLFGGGRPGRTADNYFDTCATVLQYGQKVAELTGAELVVRETPSPDTRDYGWGKPNLDSLDLVPLLDWTRAHLDEIDLTRRQVIL